MSFLLPAPQPLSPGGCSGARFLRGGSAGAWSGLGQSAPLVHSARTSWEVWVGVQARLGSSPLSLHLPLFHPFTMLFTEQLLYADTEDRAMNKSDKIPSSWPPGPVKTAKEMLNYKWR